MKKIACLLTAAALGLAPLAACQSTSSSLSREDETNLQNNQGTPSQQNISSDTDSDMPSDQDNERNGQGKIEPGSLGADE